MSQSSPLRQPLTLCKRRDPDKTSLRANRVLRDVASLELAQAPGIPYLIPKEYASRPRLNGKLLACLVVNGGPIWLTSHPCWVEELQICMIFWRVVCQRLASAFYFHCVKAAATLLKHAI